MGGMGGLAPPAALAWADVGSSARRLLGSSAPRPLGPSAPRPLGPRLTSADLE